jgi:phosphoenolpyruvate carboxykinase (ATP)
MALNPVIYANLLGEKIAKHNVKVWLINTGWSGGPYGVGSRVKLEYTRAMVTAALEGTLDDVPMRTGKIFGLQVPEKCPGVPDDVLYPRSTWADAAAYDAQTKKLAGMFAENFEPFAAEVPEAVRAAGPKV